MGWWKENAETVEAVAASVTACMAVAALIGVAMQVRAQHELDRQQAARDLYREHLSLTISAKDIASLDYCSDLPLPQETAYEAYVEHLVYTIEQSAALDADLEKSLAPLLVPHKAYFCTNEGFEGYPEAVRILRLTCPAEPMCAATD